MFIIETTMMGKGMSGNKKAKNGKPAPQICGQRINNAKIKIGKEVQEKGFFGKAPERSNDPATKFTTTAEGNETQGQSLTSACVRSNAWENAQMGRSVMSENGLDDGVQLGGTLGFTLESGAAPTQKIDYERYRDFFDDPAISDERKDEIIRMLFLFGHAFYDAGFGYEFASQACGKLGECEDGAPAGGKDVVSSEAATLTEQFNLYAR